MFSGGIVRIVFSRRLLVASVVLAIAGTTLPSTVAVAEVSERSRAMLSLIHERQPAPSQGAAPQHVDPDHDCLEDEPGDTTDSRADIILWCAYMGDDEVRVAMALANGTTPRTHSSWDGMTAAGWVFDVNGDDEPDYTALLVRVQGEVIFELLDEDGDLTCRADRSQADTTIYQASFASHCLGGAETAQVLALMIFDSAPGSGSSDDLHLDAAPDSGPATVRRHVHSAAPSPTPKPAPAPAPAPRGGLRATGRIAGPDRLSTAVAISQRAFPDGAPVVYLARPDLTPDARVAGALSDGPGRLVPACGPLPQVVADEIRRLGALEVFALGGAGSVCQQLLDAAANA